MKEKWRRNRGKERRGGRKGGRRRGNKKTKRLSEFSKKIKKKKDKKLRFSLKDKKMSETGGEDEEGRKGQKY